MTKSLNIYLKNTVAVTAGLLAYTAAGTGIEAKADTNWTGFYVGALVGDAWSKNDTNMREVCDFDGGTDAVCPQINTSGNNVNFGALVGYMQPLAPNYLWGLEADYSWMGLSNSTSGGYNPDSDGCYLSAPGGSGCNFHQNDKLDWLATLRARLGYTSGNTLIYLTGGVAYAGQDHSLSIPCPDCFTPYNSRFTSSSTDFGYVGGGGIEHYLTDNVSLRVETLFGHFDGSSANDIKTGTYSGTGVKVHFGATDFIQTRLGLAFKW